MMIDRALVGSRVWRAAVLALGGLLAAACGGGSPAPETDESAALKAMDWEQILQQARGQEVAFSMWLGDPQINAYMQDYVVPEVAERYGITLKPLPGQPRIVSTLLTEMEAGRRYSSVDMVWINGEFFYQLRQIDALWGPFTELLPTDTLVRWQDPTVAMDFQLPVDGFEAPWGNVHFLLISDRERVPAPPSNPEALARWIQNHPGRFTWDLGFTGMSFLKSMMYAFAEEPAELHGAFDEAVYTRLRDRVFAWVRSVQPQLWQGGRTFPDDVAQLHTLFASGEIDFTMSFNDGEVANKIDSGLFPESAYAFALDSGTLRNSHYIGIPRHARHKAGALVAIAFLQSPEAQWRKLQPEVWGDGHVLDLARLAPEWRERIRATQRGRKGVPPRETLDDDARREPAAQYMLRLSDDFRRQILRQAPAGARAQEAG